MEKVFVACSVLAAEIKQAMSELGLNNRVLYINSMAHLDFNVMKETLTNKLKKAREFGKPLIIVGSNCHPEIKKIVAENQGRSVLRSNCIEILLGDKMKEFDREAKTIYLTTGWLQYWPKMINEGNLDEAPKYFSSYERILLIDTGVGRLDECAVQQFAEFTRLPVETYKTTLSNLKAEILALLNNEVRQ